MERSWPARPPVSGGWRCTCYTRRLAHHGLEARAEDEASAHAGLARCPPRGWSNTWPKAWHALQESLRGRWAEAALVLQQLEGEVEVGTDRSLGPSWSLAGGRHELPGGRGGVRGRRPCRSIAVAAAASQRLRWLAWV